MQNTFRKAAVVAGGVAGALALSVGAADAAITVTPNQDLTAGATVTITGTGLSPGQLGFVYECFESDTTKPTFDFANDCYSYSQVTFVADASGNATISGYQILAETDQVNGEYACGRETPGTEGTLPPENVRDTCYIRINSNTPQDNATDQFFPIEFVYNDVPIPEAPYAALLPIGALAVLGGGYLVLRNRRSPTAA